MPIGKIYQKPEVPRTPMNKRADRWDDIKNVKAPFAATDAKTFGYWFNYLWEEARQADGLSAGDKARLCDAFFAVLYRSGATFVPYPDKMSNDRKRQILTTLLTIGFKRVALGGLVPAAGGFVSVARALDATAVFVQQMQYARGGGMRTVHLGFRADGRKYEDLCKQGGFQARARSMGQDVHRDYGLDQPWHPFSLSVYADSLFLRKGINKDNCLHTVVSVGLEFEELLPYPLLSDGTVFRWAHKPLSQWTQQDEIDAKAHKLSVRAVREAPNGPIDHLESEIRIFVVCVDQARAFSTKAWQKDVGVANPFPEAAVDSIGVDSIVAEIEITRKHFFDNGDLSFYDFAFKSTRLLPSEDAQAIKYGSHFPIQLRQKISMLEGAARGAWRAAKARYDQARLQAAAPKGAAAEVTCPKCGKKMKPVQFKMHKC